jgi:hypothetical protein
VDFPRHAPDRVGRHRPLRPGSDRVLAEMRMTITFATAESRDQALEVGMAEGMEATYANMDRLLAG